MMRQSFYGVDGGNGFREYLTSNMGNMFALDLSGCSVIECIEKMCEIKERAHPKIRRNYAMLVKKLGSIERMFGCRIMPAMISGIFWNHFVPFLADQGLKYSTIGHVKANLIAVLNWSSKYGVKLNPSYSEVDIPNYINTLSIDSRITFAILEKYGYHAPFTGEWKGRGGYGIPAAAFCA